MGAAAVPIILAAVGTGAQMLNTQQVEKRQKEELNRTLLQQQARDREGANVVNALVGDVRASSPEAAQAQALEEYMQGVRRGQAIAAGGLNQGGAVSDRYTSDAATAAAGILGDATTRAGQLAAIDAPIRQRELEGIRFNRAGTDIDLLQGAVGSDRFLADLRLKAASRRDPWLDALGSLAQSYGAAGGDFGLSGAGGNATQVGQALKSGLAVNTTNRGVKFADFA